MTLDYNIAFFSKLKNLDKYQKLESDPGYSVFEMAHKNYVL